MPATAALLALAAVSTGGRLSPSPVQTAAHTEAVAVAPDMAYSAALYAEAETIPDLPRIHPWGRNAPEGANLAVETLASYVNLTGLALPPLRVETVVCDLATAVGCWDGDAITLVPGLSREQAFYVTLHELLHWGGFGTAAAEPWAQAVWRAEHTGGRAPVFYAAGEKHPGHWDTRGATGTHRASHMAASAELMDPKLRFADDRVSAYVSAASLAACGRFAGRFQWCVDDADCSAVGAECVSVGRLMPRRCSTGGQAATADDIALDRAAVMGYTAAGVVGAVAVTVGLAAFCW